MILVILVSVLLSFVSYLNASTECFGYDTVDNRTCTSARITNEIPIGTALCTTWPYLREVEGIGWKSIPSDLSLCKHMEGIMLTDSDIIGTFPRELFEAWKLTLRVFSVFAQNWDEVIDGNYSLWENLEVFRCQSTSKARVLPEELSKWGHHIRVFDFKDTVSGTLPIHYSSWTRIEEFNLIGSQITGTLPRQYDTWTNIVTFHVNYMMSLSGTLPPPWYTWTHIERFSIERTSLSGTVPSEWCTWTKLKHFSVRVTKVGILDATVLSWNASLVTLIGNENDYVIDHIIVGNFTMLQTFDFTETSLRGTIPDEVQSWTSLQYFSISKTAISGTLPHGVTFWTQLKTFDIGLTSISGTLPEGLSQWSRIETFLASSTTLAGTLHQGFRSWSSITTLDLKYTLFSGTLSYQFSAWTQLKTLNVAFTKLSGTLSAAWSHWTNMQNLNIDFTKVSGTLPPALSAWSLIETFHFPFTRISGTVPSEFRAWTRLGEFSMHSTLITGAVLSSDFFTWENVGEVKLSPNTISGTFPTQLYTWTLIQKLHAFSCSMSGTLPPEYSSWAKITEFDIHGSFVSGTIPASYSHWNALQYFDVSDTGLSGTIPASLSAWARIKNMYFHDANVSGWLPPTFSTLSTLSEIRADNSWIEGPLFNVTKLGLLSLIGMSSLTEEDFWRLLDELPPGITTVILIYMAFPTLVHLTNRSYPEIEFDFSYSANLTFGNTFVAKSLKCVGCEHVMTELPTVLDTVDMSETKWEALPTLPPNVRVVTFDDSRFFDDSGEENNGGTFSEWSAKIPQTVEMLSMQSCDIYGTLPMDVFTRVSHALNLRGNWFEGDLPNITNNISTLVNIILSLNNLEGPLPPSWNSESFPNLEKLDLSFNYIASATALSTFPMTIREVRLPYNELTAFDDVSSLPEGLTLIDLSHNPLQGQFPKSIVERKVTRVYLRNTSVSSLPESLWDTLEVLDMFNTTWNQNNQRLFPSWYYDPLPSSVILIDLTPRVDPQLRLMQSYKEYPTLLINAGVSQFFGSPFVVRNTEVANKMDYALFAQYLSCYWCSELTCTESLTHHIPADILTDIQTISNNKAMEKFLSSLCIWSMDWNAGLFSSVVISQCTVLCGTPILEVISHPQLLQPGVLEPMVVQFAFPETLERKYCRCPDVKDYYNEAAATDYTFTIIPQSDSMIPPMSFPATFTTIPGGVFQLPSFQYDFVFNVTYMISLRVFGVRRPAYSNPFELASCADRTKVGMSHTMECLACPPGGICNGTIHIFAAYNMWRPSQAFSTFLPCDEQSLACVVGTKQQQQQQRIGSECADGYQGFTCRECAFLYAKSGPSQCVRCADDLTINYLIFIAIFCAMILFQVMLSLNAAPNASDGGNATTTTAGSTNANNDNKLMLRLQKFRLRWILPIQCFLKIILSWMFCVGTLFRSKIATSLLSAESTTLFHYEFEVATLSPASSNAFGCITAFPVYSGFLVFGVGSVPTIVLVILIVYVLNKVLGIGPRKKWPMAVYSTAMCCVSLLYSQIIVAVTQLLQCDTYTLEQWSSSKIHTHSLLRADVRISCDTDEQYKTYRLGAILVGVVVTVVVPCFSVVLYRRVSPEVLNFLAADVQPHAWWWELSVMTRKATVLFCITSIDDDVMQLMAFLYVSFVFWILHAVTQPYSLKMYNVMEALGITSCIVSALVLVVLSQYPEEGRIISVTLLVINGVLCGGFLFGFVKIMFRAKSKKSHISSHHLPKPQQQQQQTVTETNQEFASTRMIFSYYLLQGLKTVIHGTDFTYEPKTTRTRPIQPFPFNPINVNAEEVHVDQEHDEHITNIGCVQLITLSSDSFSEGEGECEECVVVVEE